MRKLFRQIFSGYDASAAQQHDTFQRKYEKSGLTLHEAIEIKEKIKWAFEEDKLYKNNAIGLNDLAKHIAKDRYKVSQVLNEYLAKNFYALLNEYRIAEAKELLISQPFLSVKAVMYEVGFNSKTSFYSAFRKETGQSPNDFRNLAIYAS